MRVLQRKLTSPEPSRSIVGCSRVAEVLASHHPLGTVKPPPKPVLVPLPPVPVLPPRRFEQPMETVSVQLESTVTQLVLLLIE